MFRFSESRLVIPISVESVKNVERRRAQIIKKRNASSVSENVSDHAQARGGEARLEDVESAMTVGLEDVPERSENVSLLIYTPFQIRKRLCSPTSMILSRLPSIR
jgi:hypothetical protein